MYIEFQLPIHTTSQGAARANQILTQALHAWSDQYSIPYIVKNHKLVKRITFDDDAQYSFFAMTWNVDKTYRFLARWRIVSDLNNKTTFDCVL